jgi:non-specific serine/threonine protein kinase
LVWLERLDAEHDNFRAALEWALPRVAAQAETARQHRAAQMAVGLHSFWIVRGHFSEAQDWLERLLSRIEDAPGEIRAQALAAAMWVAIFQGDLERLPSLAREAGPVIRDVREGQRTLWMLSVLMLASAYSGRADEAAALASEIERRLPVEKDPWSAGFACNSLLMLAFAREDYQTVAALGEQAVAFFRKSGDMANRVSAVGLAGLASLHLGDLSRAEAAFREILLLADELKAWRALNAALVGFAALCCRRDQPERAARLLGAAEAQRQARAVSILPWGVRLIEDVVAKARQALGEPAFEAAWADGRALSMEQALACAGEAPTEPATGSSGAKQPELRDTPSD